MSGNEQGFKRMLTFDQGDVDLFQRTQGATGTNFLRSGTQMGFSGNRPGKYLDAGAQTQVEAFNAWKSERDASAEIRKEYLKLASDRPGRKSTILVETGEPSQDLLLTGSDIGQGMLLV